MAARRGRVARRSAPLRRGDDPAGGERRAAAGERRASRAGAAGGVGRPERRVPDQRGRQPRQPAAGTHAARQRDADLAVRAGRSARVCRLAARDCQRPTCARTPRRSPASCARALGVSLETTQRVVLFVAARGVLSAAVRLGVTGSYEAQRLQSRVRRRGRRPCWRATATPDPPTWRRPRRSSTSCRGRTTGSTRASSSPEC